MKRCLSFKSPSRRKQSGSSMMESLISILLMGIVGVGVTFVTSKVSTTQKDMNESILSVSGMQSLMLSHGTTGGDLCTNAMTMQLGSNVTSPNIAGCGDTLNETTLLVGTNGLSPAGGFTYKVPVTISLYANDANKKVSMGGL